MDLNLVQLVQGEISHFVTLNPRVFPKIIEIEAEEPRVTIQLDPPEVRLTHECSTYTALPCLSARDALVEWRRMVEAFLLSDAAKVRMEDARYAQKYDHALGIRVELVATRNATQSMQASVRTWTDQAAWASQRITELTPRLVTLEAASHRNVAAGDNVRCAKDNWVFEKLDSGSGTGVPIRCFYKLDGLAYAGEVEVCGDQKPPDDLKVMFWMPDIPELPPAARLAVTSWVTYG